MRLVGPYCGVFRRIGLSPQHLRILDPHLGHTVVDRLSLTVAGQQRMRLHITLNARQLDHHVGMFRPPVLLEGFDRHARFALEK